MRKKLFFNPLFIFLSLLIAAAASYHLISKTNNESSAGENFAVINGKVIDIEIADSFSEQAQGLSGRESLPNDSGMLFVFPNKQVRSFWMKNMHFPIDIIWIDQNKIVNISRELQPEGEQPEKTYNSQMPVNYVLEVNAGFADKYGIRAGDTVKIVL